MEWAEVWSVTGHTEELLSTAGETVTSCLIKQSTLFTGQIKPQPVLFVILGETIVFSSGNGTS